MAANPLTLIIFGASGDLTARKLIPSLYNLALKKRLPPELAIVGVARSPFTDDNFREKLAPAAREFVKGDMVGRFVERFRPAHPLRAWRCQQTRGTGRLARLAATGGRLGDRPAPLLSRRLPRPVRIDPHQPQRVRPCRQSRFRVGCRRRLEKADHREAVRQGSGVGPGAERRRAGPFSRGPDLPHRPLPGQGDGAEHPGVPLRQHAVRAAVEQQLHRSRSDHRQRNGEGGRPGRLLRPQPACCATCSRTTCCNC